MVKTYPCHAKCEKCEHVWQICGFPIPIADFVSVAGNARCPECLAASDSVSILLTPPLFQMLPPAALVAQEEPSNDG